jgi:hypothetical protein
MFQFIMNGSFYDDSFASVLDNKSFSIKIVTRVFWMCQESGYILNQKHNSYLKKKIDWIGNSLS